jgi:hypothetical protein
MTKTERSETTPGQAREKRTTFDPGLSTLAVGGVSVESYRSLTISDRSQR